MEKQILLILFSCFIIIGSTYCQEIKSNNYEVIKKLPLGYNPLESKTLPILITTQKGKKILQALENKIEYLNAKKEQRDSMVEKSRVKLAYLGHNGDILVPFGKYDFADVFGVGRKAIVSKQGKYGIIDENGKLVLPCEYDYIQQPSIYSKYTNIFLAKINNSVIVFDQNLSIISSKDILDYWEVQGNIFVINKEKKIGIIDYEGKQKIPFIYDTLYTEHSVPRISSLIGKIDSLYGLISLENEIIQPFNYKYIYALNYGLLAYVDKNNKVGILNHDGSIMIPFEYDAIHSNWYSHDYQKKEFPNTENIFIVEKNGKIGTIDGRNNEIIPIIYDGLSGWIEYGPEAHYAIYNGKYGIISYKGEVIIPIVYDYVGIPQNDIMLVRKNGKYGVISWQNKSILPCTFEKIIFDIPFLGLEMENKIPKIITLNQENFSFFDLEGNVLKSIVPKKEIKEKYEFMLLPDDLSNEFYYYDFKRKGGLMNAYWKEILKIDYR